MTPDTSFYREYHHEVAASPEAVWRVLSTPAGWSRWNAGVHAVELHGPFAEGTPFAMTLPDGETIDSRLLQVDPPRRFVDETVLGDTAVRVDHRIEPIAPGRCRVTFAVQAEGPQAAAMGEGASADFPEVLAGLARFVGHAAEVAGEAAR